MTDTLTAASMAERTRPIDAGAAVVGAHFLGRTAVLVLGEEAVLLVDVAGESRRVTVHGGGILASAADGSRVVTAGDDGKLVATEAAGETAVLATDARGRWIDRVALGPDAIAWSAGKQAFVRAAKGADRAIDVPSSPGGLAFAPKGLRLAVAHYGGVSLWFPGSDAKPETRSWKGSHLDATFSPDGRFLVTAMQEPTLHAWRLADFKDMRMSGYAAKVRSLSWTAGGKWLATSGSDQLILWPFSGKDGPMGKQPRMLAPYDKRAVAVAAHPTQEIVAVAFDDGLVMLVRIEDGAEVVARRKGGSAATALAWSADGATLCFGCESGEAGLVDLS